MPRISHGIYTPRVILVGLIITLGACGGAPTSLSPSITPQPPSGGSSPSIFTNDLAPARVQSPYQATLKASGGNPPYEWKVASGSLPPGLALDPASGKITGSATQAGQYPVSFGVTNANGSGNSDTKSFTIQVMNAVDKYGGTPQLPCPSGAASHFYTQKIGNRWWLCDPAGNTFWMQAVYVVDVPPNGPTYTNAVTSKYGDDGPTWGPQQNRRLLAWGFNAIGNYSNLDTLPTTTESSWPNGQQPVKMPFVGLIDAAYYSLRNRGNYANGPVKDLVAPISTSVYNGYRGQVPDVWDPNYQMWLEGALKNDPAAQEWINGPNNDYLIGLNVDDGDYLLGFGAGPNFKTVDNGQANGGDVQPNLAWLILVTPATQTSNSALGVTYSDPTVYSKQALVNFLEQRYGTIAALDLAWGATYTAFTSVTGGTGLTDELGLNSWIPKDFVNLSGATAAMQKDLDDFLDLTAQHYFSEIKSAIQQYAPGRLYLGPTTLGSWGTPPRAQILQAASSYLDAFVAPSIPSGASDDQQQRIDFIEQNFGDKPWLEWEGFAANPDSYFSNYPAGDTVQAPATTQANRGQMYTNMVNSLLNARASAGPYPVVGFSWWELVDDPNQHMNWGLVTPLDNEYDGLAARAAQGADSWGYSTGGEAHDFGDFLSAVLTANFSVLPTLLSKQW